MGNDLGSRAKSVRLSLGLTQDDVAEAAHITTAMVSLVENGHRQPGAEATRGLCDALGVSADYLLGIKWNILAMTDQIACQARAMLDHTFPEGEQDGWPQWLVSFNAIVDQYMKLRNLTGIEYPSQWEGLDE